MDMLPNAVHDDLVVVPMVIMISDMNVVVLAINDDIAMVSTRRTARVAASLKENLVGVTSELSIFVSLSIFLFDLVFLPAFLSTLHMKRKRKSASFGSRCCPRRDSRLRRVRRQGDGVDRIQSDK